MLTELQTIISIQGTTQENGLEARKLALQYWIDRHVTEIVIENSVIKKHLNASELDFLKGYQAFQIADKLLEDHATVVTEGNKVIVKVLVLNKEFPKNKDK